MAWHHFTVGVSVSRTSEFNRQVFTQVINLDRCDDRLATITGELIEARISFSRFDAIDGRNLAWPDDPRIQADIDLKKWVACHHRNPIPADVGCYLSHLGAIRAFLAQDKPYGLILEDDAKVPRSLVSLLAPVLADDAFDILKLHVRHPGPLAARKVYNENCTLSSILGKHAGATAYLITKRAAERMVSHMVPGCKMNDWVYDEAHKMGLRLRTIDPMPVGLHHVGSTIESERDKSNRSWIEKQVDRPLSPRWALFFVRAWDEFHRGMFNLFTDGCLKALILGPEKVNTMQVEAMPPGQQPSQRPTPTENYNRQASR